MINKSNKSIEIPEFLSIVGSEFVQYTGYGVYAFLTHKAIYNFYKQFATAEIPLQTFAKKLVKEHLAHR